MAGWLVKRLGNGLFGLIDIDSPLSSPAVTANVTFPSFSRSDTFTGTGTGTIVDVTSAPTKSYSISVKGTGGSASLWDIRLEGSLDGVNFSTLLQHTQATLDTVVLSSGAVIMPALYIRSKVAGLTLGSASNVVVTIIGL